MTLRAPLRRTHISHESLTLTQRVKAIIESTKDADLKGKTHTISPNVKRDRSNAKSLIESHFNVIDTLGVPT